MSLDVYLRRGDPRERESEPQIFIRRDGRTVEITRAEWDELYPDREPVVAMLPRDESEVFHANITHNLTRMARECGLYEPLWEPEENGYRYAAQLIEPLRDGLALLFSEPERFRQFNPANGWGNYESLCEFTIGYLAACKEWPDAEVSVWK
jgi:hypothetical protein